MTKAEYLRELLVGKLGDSRLADAALIYWHSEIPIYLAKIFIENLERKLNHVGNVQRVA